MTHVLDRNTDIALLYFVRPGGDGCNVTGLPAKRSTVAGATKLQAVGSICRSPALIDTRICMIKVDSRLTSLNEILTVRSHQDFLEHATIPTFSVQPCASSQTNPLKIPRSAPLTSEMFNEVYQPLAVREIRLFELFPTTTESRLQGKLVNVHVRNLPRYVALTYSWGGVPEQTPVSVHLATGESQVILVSGNLGAALVKLRNRLSGMKFLWIDQVCINQNDRIEKQHQIKMMRDIYTRANRVIVWLGNPTQGDNAEQAMWTAACLNQFNHKTEYTTSTVFEHLIRNVRTETHAAVSPAAYATAGWDCLLSLWKRPWFERLWVRQEYILAKDVRFIYGSSEIPSETLIQACEVQYQAAMKFGSAIHASLKGPQDRAVLSILHITQARELFDFVKLDTKKKPAEEREDMLDLLRFTFFLRHDKSHDLVYATYQLSSAATHSNFWPNYDKPIEQLWRELAAYLLNDHTKWNNEVPFHGNPDKSHRVCPAVILALPVIEEGNAPRNTPSWVPVFDRLKIRGTQKFDHYYFYSRKYRAGGESRFVPQIDLNGQGNLVLEGILLAEVASTIPGTEQPRMGSIAEPRLFESDDYWTFVHDEVVPWYLKCRRFAAGYTGPFHELISQGLYAYDVNVRRQRLLPKIASDKPKAFIERFRQSDLLRSFSIPIDTVPVDLAPWLCKAAWQYDNRDDTRILIKLSDNRFGWASNKVRAGDLVILVKGAPFPFVVTTNRMTGRFQMLGDAYIDGVMKGEAWKDHQSGLKEFEFE